MAQFSLNGLTIEYLTFGEGDDVILCFHGFGRHASDFRVFTSLLTSNQRMIAINLFGHGASTFPPQRIYDQPLTPEEWRLTLTAFLDQLHAEKFHLLGYSMGGRIAMKTVELLPDRVKSLLLIAPDGFKINPLYRFASGTIVGKKMYTRLINNPRPLFAIANALNKTGILNDKLHRFVHVHLDSEAQRQMVYDVWLIYKLTFPNLQNLARIIRTKKIPFHMIFGRYDSVITPALGKKFSRIMGTEEHLFLIEAGHRLMTEQTAQFIWQHNLWPRHLTKRSSKQNIQ